MLRPALTAGLTISVLAANVALVAPAMAGGEPDAFRPAPAASGRVRPGNVPAPRSVRGPHRPGLVRFRGSPVQPVSYGETDGAVFHAWLPRNADLPIYNIPPPFFPEP